MIACDDCRLGAGAASFVFGSGDPDAALCVVGEGPGPDEDRLGLPFVGRAGRLLTRWLKRVGIDRDAGGVYVTNVVKHFPNDGGAIRAPRPDEIEACAARWLRRELAALPNLKVLVPLGGVAASAILGRPVRISRARGVVVATPYCALTVPTFHPSHLLRGGEPPELDRLVREDLALIRSLLDGAAPAPRAAGVGLSQHALADLNAAAARNTGDVAAAERAAAAARGEETEAERRAAFEQKIIQAPPWNPARRYIGGWSDERDVVLLYRDAEGARRLERVAAFPWYFYMRTDDALRVPPDVWRAWKRWGVFERLEADPASADWTRVYAVRKVTQTRWLRDRGEVGVGINILDDPRARKVGGADTEAGAAGRVDREKAWKIAADARRKGMDEARRRMAAGGGYSRIDEGFQILKTRAIGGKRGFSAEAQTIQARESANWKKYESEVKLHDFLIVLHETGPTFEADLTPKQRFMTDHFLQIEDRYNELFFDIETDDSVPGWENKETWRHLAVAAILKTRDGAIEPHSFVAEAETDAAEAAMHRAFAALLDRADVVYAWNGFNFDFPILRARFRRHRIDYDWRHVTWCDLLAVWRRYHFRSASAVTSYALGELGPKVLHREKLDWRAESERRGRRCSTILELYRHQPELLREYNERDVELLYGLEEAMGYAGVERVFCRIGNSFVNDYHVSTKIDMLLLNKGSANGNHFYTRGLQFEFLPAYIAEKVGQATRAIGAAGEVAVDKGKGERAEYVGAYVFPPVVGYHEGVAALDFKSLYPTVMTLFNISPETWVPRDDAARADPADLISTPSGAFFRRGATGMIPLVFRETMEKRKVYTKLQLGEEIGSERFLLYYRLAYAYKRLGLSFYGELGNETSRYFNPEVAEAVTLGGQWFIKRTAELAERRGYRVLAGDTDSLYLKMTEAQAEAFVKECDAYYREIVRPFNVDMERFLVELEYENYFRSIVFVRKKRYAGRMTVFKGKPSDVLEVKGLEMMRSDGLERARRFQRETLEFILARSRPTAAAVAALVARERDVVLSGRLTVDDVSATQSIEKPVEEYKTKPPHVRVAERIRATSTEYYVGMKVPFVVTATRPKLEAVWAREYVEGTYDAAYAWNKKIYPPTLRVLDAAYPGEDWDRFLVDDRPPRKRAAPRKTKARAGI